MTDPCKTCSGRGYHEVKSKATAGARERTHFGGMMCCVERLDKNGKPIPRDNTPRCNNCCGGTRAELVPGFRNVYRQVKCQKCNGTGKPPTITKRKIVKKAKKCR